MKTKEKIKHKALVLFNQKGFKNVTLRAIASALGKSYGNITYHYKSKEDLIMELYKDMILETSEIMSSFESNNLFHGILDVPKKTFAISMKYLFFYVDYVEVKRSYQKIYLEVEDGNAMRKQYYMELLKELQGQEILRRELTPKDLDYLMDLSGAMRTFFFINLHLDNFTDPDLEDKYIAYVNQLVVPYLSTSGLEMYKAYLK